MVSKQELCRSVATMADSLRGSAQYVDKQAKNDSI